LITTLNSKSKQGGEHDARRLPSYETKKHFLPAAQEDGRKW